MKRMKKLMSVMLALVMVLAMSTTVFAQMEGPTPALTQKGTITINDAVPEETYNIYQILYLESINTESGAYAYKANSEWKSFIEGPGVNGIYFDTNDGYVTWHEVEGETTVDKAARVEAFAKLAQNNIPETADMTAVAPAAAGGKDYSTVKFENLKLGYYLVDTTLGTLCSLDTTNPTVEMFEKNETPSNEKKIVEGENKVDSNSVNVGDTVHYESTITAHKGAQAYVFKDNMSDGLTLDRNSIQVKVGETVLTKDTNYTISYPNTEDPDDFNVTFDQTYLDSITADTTIVISYNAVLNEGAVIAGEGNTNKSKLQYGTSTEEHETPDSTVTTYTYDFAVLKFTMNGQTKVNLEGAKFTLSRNENGTPAIQFVAEETANTYRVATAKEIADKEITKVTEITTDNTGKFQLNGLDEGTYYLTETKAPDGYNKLNGAVKVVIDETAPGTFTVKKDTVATTDGTIEVENNTGAELPSTGGIGTTIFYVLGSILLVGAGVLLVTKKRMGTK